MCTFVGTKIFAFKNKITLVYMAEEEKALRAQKGTVYRAAIQHAQTAELIFHLRTCSGPLFPLSVRDRGTQQEVHRHGVRIALK